MTKTMPLQLCVESRDPEDAQRQLTLYYCPHRVVVNKPSPEFLARQFHVGSGGVNAYHLSFGPGSTSVCPMPFGEFVLVSRVMAGQFRVTAAGRQRVLRRGDSIALDPYTMYNLQWEANCSILTIQLHRNDVERAAAGITGADECETLRFPVAAEPNRRALTALAHVTGFLIRDVLPQDMLAAPSLMRGQLISLLTAAILDAYPYLRGEPQHRSAGTVRPSALRRATAFIEQSADGDIDINDIAAAARLSPRALQESFRKHLETTPMCYLRSVRLQRARADLRAAGHTQTVAAVAYRWGFQNLGRFAQYYRDEFGRLPSEERRRG